MAAPLTEHVCFRDELQKNLLASDDSCKQRSAKRKADETTRCSRFRTRTYIRVRRECMHCSSKSGRQTFEGSKIGFWGSRENELRLHLLLLAAASAAVWRKDFQEQSCEASRNVMWYLSKFHDFPPPSSIFSGKFVKPRKSLEVGHFALVCKNDDNFKSMTLSDQRNSRRCHSFLEWSISPLGLGKKFDWNYFKITHNLLSQGPIYLYLNKRDTRVNFHRTLRLFLEEDKPW